MELPGSKFFVEILPDFFVCLPFLKLSIVFFEMLADRFYPHPKLFIHAKIEFFLNNFEI